MSSDDEMEKLLELIEELQISIKKHPEIENDVNSHLKKLLFNLQNEGIVSNDIQYDINASPGYQLITNRFGKVSQATIINIANQLSYQSQIPISRDIYRKSVLLLKWIDCHLHQFAPLIETMELPPSQ